MKQNMPIKWNSTLGIANGTSYDCGYCKTKISAHYILVGIDGYAQSHYIYLCTSCSKPTYYSPADKNQIPAPGIQTMVRNIADPLVKALFEEAANCFKFNAFSSISMLCRKILMHVAVEKGAKENDTFKYYVDFLASNGWVPPNGREWLDKIKKMGNDVNHQIIVSNPDDTLDIFKFTELLLMFTNEYTKAPVTVSKVAIAKSL
jgi:hypothetical protein